MKISSVFSHFLFRFFLSLSIILAVPYSGQSKEASIHAVLSNNLELLLNQTSFSLNELLHLDIWIKDFTTGTELRIDWIDPQGKISDQFYDYLTANREFGTYRNRINMKFRKLGFSTRVFSSQEYPDHFFGEWKINFYISGKKIKALTFNML